MYAAFGLSRKPDGLARPGLRGRRRRPQPDRVAVRPGLGQVPLERLRHLPAGRARAIISTDAGRRRRAGVPQRLFPRHGPAGHGHLPEGLPVAVRSAQGRRRRLVAHRHPRLRGDGRQGPAGLPRLPARTPTATASSSRSSRASSPRRPTPTSKDRAPSGDAHRPAAEDEPARRSTLYRSHGIDLAREPLEIAVCAQHNNGGFRASIWWESNVRGLFPVGEVCGTHGVNRPGGSALNAGQVGSARAALFIARRRAGRPLADAAFARAAEALVLEKRALAEAMMARGSERALCRRRPASPRSGGGCRPAAPSSGTRPRSARSRPAAAELWRRARRETPGALRPGPAPGVQGPGHQPDPRRLSRGDRRISRPGREEPGLLSRPRPGREDAAPASRGALGVLARRGRRFRRREHPRGPARRRGPDAHTLGPRPAHPGRRRAGSRRSGTTSGTTGSSSRRNELAQEAAHRGARRRRHRRRPRHRPGHRPRPGPRGVRRRRHRHRLRSRQPEEGPLRGQGPGRSARRAVPAGRGRHRPDRGPRPDARRGGRSVRRGSTSWSTTPASPRSKRVDILETAPESYDRLLAVNARGPFFLTQNAAKRMAAQKARGRTASGRRSSSSPPSRPSSPRPSRAEYCISKAALSMTAALFADALAAKGINVYEVRPGIIATDMTAGVKDKYDRLIAGGPRPPGTLGPSRGRRPGRGRARPGRLRLLDRGRHRGQRRHEHPPALITGRGVCGPGPV